MQSQSHKLPGVVLLCLSLFSLLALSGCGGGTSRVKGKVTMDGKAVVWGSVTLVDESGMFHQGAIEQSGNYTIERVPVGKVKIGVYSPDPYAQRRGGGGGIDTTSGQKADPNDPRSKFKTEAPPGPPPPPKGTWFAIPSKFVDPMNSGLTGVVKSGETELNIELK